MAIGTESDHALIAFLAQVCRIGAAYDPTFAGDINVQIYQLGTERLDGLRRGGYGRYRCRTG